MASRASSSTWESPRLPWVEAVVPQHEAGAQKIGVRGAHDGGDSNYGAAVVGIQGLLGEGEEVGALPEGVKEEVHRAAADEPVAGGDLFVEEVVLELRAAPEPHNFFGGEPDVSLNAAAAEGADAGAVFPDK